MYESEGALQNVDKEVEYRIFKILSNFTPTTKALCSKKLDAAGRQYKLNQERRRLSIFGLKHNVTIDHPLFLSDMIPCDYFFLSELKIAKEVNNYKNISKTFIYEF